MNKLLAGISGIGGVIGSFIAGLFGGWDIGISVLCIFIMFDLITGLTSAALCKSKKSESGGINSKVIWIGIMKKILELMMVVIGHQLDLLIGANYIRDAVVIAYIITETISIIENAGLIGLPVPTVITKVIDVLKNKNDNTPVE